MTNTNENNVPVLKVSDLNVAYFTGKNIINNLNFSLQTKEVVAIIGGNGTGKSTFLKALAGLLKPVSGTVLFHGQDITGLPPDRISRMGIGYLIQGGEVFSGLTVLENLSLAANNGHKKGQTETAYHYFPQLEKFKNKRAGLLSGGERQMLAIAMVMVRQPKLMLLDEPSAGLAQGLVEMILDKIVAYVREHECSAILVEQNIRQAIKRADKACKLNKGEIGQILKETIIQELIK